MKKCIKSLFEKFESNSFYKIYIFLLNLDHIEYVIKDNYKELIKHINKYEKEVGSISKKPQDPKFTFTKRRNHLRKFIKYFYNYVSAVYSLEGICKYFFDNDNDLKEDCLRQRKKMIKELNNFKENPFRLFVFGLRNNISHYKILPVSISIEYRKALTVKEEVIFITRGVFHIKKMLILLDHRNAKPKKDKKGKSSPSQSYSEFLSDNHERELLYNFIIKKYKKDNYINLKDVIDGHYRILLDYINNMRNELKNCDLSRYKEIKKIYKEIIELQDKI